MCEEILVEEAIIRTIKSVAGNYDTFYAAKRSKFKILISTLYYVTYGSELYNEIVDCKKLLRPKTGLGTSS